MTQMTGGQAVVAALKAEGVEVIFGIPGTQNLPIFDALVDEPAIRLIANRHEQGAGYMADGYARASGRPGVLVTVSGPGATNALSPLGQAFADSSPVLLLASQVSSRSLDRDAEDFHQLRDALKVLQSVTKWQGRARAVAAIPDLVHAAFRQLRAGRSRPVYLEIPQDVLFASGEVAIREPAAATPVAPDPSLISQAARILAGAERPAIYVGGGVITAGASAAVRELAERLQAPIVVSANGKGAVPEDHPLFVGGGWGAHNVGTGALEQADVVLALGARFGPLPTNYWTIKIPRLIHVDVDPSELGKHYPPEIGIVADAGLAAEALASALWQIAHVTPAQPWLDVASFRALKLPAIEERARPALDSLRALRAALPDDALLYNDLNLVSYWAWPGFAACGPRTFHYPTGYGCLGFALPAAVGGKLARPEAPVVALAGDGGFLYTVHELATAVQYQVGVVAVVFNSQGFAAIKLDQERNWHGRTIGVDLPSPAIADLARAFGARGLKVDRLDEVAPAVTESIGQTGPTVIEAPAPEVVPPWVM
jgi:acetolactate synthase-1/2/3 large subunit